MNSAQKKLMVVNNFKINLIFLILFISNIILYAALITHYFYYYDIYIRINTVNNLFSMIAAIIILGFITTRLPQLRKLGDSSIYEIGYLIIIGILSMVVSYFNKSTNTETFFAPYLDMFKVLSVMLILMLIATKTKPFQNMLKGKLTAKNQFLCLVIFTILGCLASKYHIYVGSTPANVRCLIMMVGGLFGGPFVGIPSAIISGGFRFIQGGPTAFPCAVSTILAGLIGSLIFIWNNHKILRGVHTVVLMFLFTGLEMLLIVLLTPKEISFGYVENVYPLMMFASVVGMILFLMIVREEKDNDKKVISYEELRINEMEHTLDEYMDKVDQLEEEIEYLKNKD